MAPRIASLPKKNRGRCGIKYPLRIIKGDLEPDSVYFDDDLDDNQALLAVADVDATEGNVRCPASQSQRGKKLWLSRLGTPFAGALATRAVDIPTPGAVTVVENYDALYPPGRWTDPVTYLQSTRTMEEACANALVDHEYTYYMDEHDKQWLDKNNQEARGEGTSALGATVAARKGKNKEPEVGIPVSITEDEFELVMGLLEKMTDQKVLVGDAPDFSLYKDFFSEPLPFHVFASYTTPSWVPIPALLVRIAQTIHPHWKQRRALLKGGRTRPAVNYDEGDFDNESYICFRRRDNKPIRKTRAGQIVNNAEKLAPLQQDMSHLHDLANVLHGREQLKKKCAAEAHDLWNRRRVFADMQRAFPALVSKGDEGLLTDKPKKIKPPKASSSSSLSHNSCQPLRGGPNTIAREVMKKSQNDHNQVDAVDDPYQPRFIPRAARMWMEVPVASWAHARRDEQPERSDSRALRMRVGRGGRRFMDRRSSRALDWPLRSHRRNEEGDGWDEERLQRLQAQWKRDADDDEPVFGPSEEQDRVLEDEFDRRYLLERTKWASEEEFTLVTDASIVVQGPDGQERKVLPFLHNAIHQAGICKETRANAASPQAARRGGTAPTPAATPPSRQASAAPPPRPVPWALCRAFTYAARLAKPRRAAPVSAERAAAAQPEPHHPRVAAGGGQGASDARSGAGTDSAAGLVGSGAVSGWGGGEGQRPAVDRDARAADPCNSKQKLYSAELASWQVRPCRGLSRDIDISSMNREEMSRILRCDFSQRPEPRTVSSAKDFLGCLEEPVKFGVSRVVSRKIVVHMMRKAVLVTTRHHAGYKAFAVRLPTAPTDDDDDSDSDQSE
ncbi:hypothetical protein B0H10DRAFT_1945410 [Mycena sp. CBHHK59/15]|nr:hypothetical protein B0H10DRAFT_1945410 [Mycena sp. CBHHK59/15]